MFFMWISEQTVITSLCSIKWLVFITEMECVYCAVRTESLSTVQRNFHVQMVKTVVNTTATFGRPVGYVLEGREREILVTNSCFVRLHIDTGFHFLKGSSKQCVKWEVRLTRRSWDVAPCRSVDRRRLFGSSTWRHISEKTVSIFKQILSFGNNLHV
jgi:hypothetical protein